MIGLYIIHTNVRVMKSTFKRTYMISPILGGKGYDFTILSTVKRKGVATVSNNPKQLISIQILDSKLPTRSHQIN